MLKVSFFLWPPSEKIIPYNDTSKFKYMYIYFTAIAHQPLITSIVPESSKNLKNEVKAAEIKMACFLAEHIFLSM